MARRRFDPSRALGGLFPASDAAAESAANPPIAAPAPERAAHAISGAAPERAAHEAPVVSPELSVTAAARLVDEALAKGLPRGLRVVGQVSNLSQRTHWYFNLKDDESVIQCVMWASRAARAGVLHDGDEVRATGTFSFYGPQGRTSFVVDSIEPRGMGALEARFRALCEELKGLGWFDEARKPALPLLPRRIAIITSRAGAALRDCLATAQARCPIVGILVVDVPVQGEGAAERIAQAIGAADRRAAELGIDAILVTRGGGSREDLWAFNERVVAEAAFRCRTPLVAAIGHEPDLEIIELVAHRAATPTRGIMTLLPDRTALRTHLDHLRVRAARAASAQLADARSRLAAISRHAFLRRPADALVERPRAALAERRHAVESAIRAQLERLRRSFASIAIRAERLRPAARLLVERERVRSLGWRSTRALRMEVSRRRESLAALRRHLVGIGPEEVLARGYSITRRSDGSILRGVAALRPGERVTTSLSLGSFESEVLSVERDGRASAS